MEAGAAEAVGAVEPAAGAGDRRDAVVAHDGGLRDLHQDNRAARVGGRAALHQMSAAGEAERDEALAAVGEVAAEAAPLLGRVAAGRVRARVDARSA